MSFPFMAIILPKLVLRTINSPSFCLNSQRMPDHSPDFHRQDDWKNSFWYCIQISRSCAAIETRNSHQCNDTGTVTHNFKDGIPLIILWSLPPMVLHSVWSCVSAAFSHARRSRFDNQNLTQLCFKWSITLAQGVGHASVMFLNIWKLQFWH